MPQITAEKLQAALADVRTTFVDAGGAFFDWNVIGGERHTKGVVEWLVQLAFLKLITLAEILGLTDLRQELSELRESAREKGFAETEMGPDEPVLTWIVTLRLYYNALEPLIQEPAAEGQTITKDLTSILRVANYTINDPDVFHSAPASEKEVHLRIESILRCMFPDLVTKPRIGKPIKNFEPDTGLPSIKTLIEYKFLSQKKDASLVADQILADTRGYTSSEWRHFLYLLYETKRVKPEAEWNRLLHSCGVPPNTSIIVLSGDDTQRAFKKAQPTRKRRPRAAT